MQIVDSAMLEPGACFINGRSEGPFVDTGYDIDDLPVHGRIYVALSTLSDMAGMFGFAAPAERDRLLAAVAERDRAIADLTDLVSGLTTANEALIKAGYKALAFAPIDDLEPSLDDALAEAEK